MKKVFGKIYEPYFYILLIYLFFLCLAFILDSPQNLYNGLVAIINSRSVLITDYVAVGGLRATLLNVVLVGVINVILLIKSQVKPHGATIMALFLTIGFSFFGKNIINMIPLTIGVKLYAMSQKKPFLNYSVVALLSATVSPVVSEIAALQIGGRYVGILVGALVGIIIGFIFPVLASFCVRIHDGYNLYNLGFVGGLISSFVLAILNAIGYDVETASLWSTGNNLVLAIALYGISGFLIIAGFVSGKDRNTLKDLKEILRHPGRLATDFFTMVDSSAYVNMGIMGILGTSVVLIFGWDLNGPTISGIMTMIGFGAFGKHLRNTVPLIIGALLGAFLNQWPMDTPSNVLAVLFSTGLAPIAGRFGPIWGIIAGALHVTFVMHVRFLNNGLNLYNNGFAAGFVALLLVPIITSLRDEREKRKQ
ncbi:MAG: DUF1576 domain-containing protein [Suipraeoptans sp.]